MGKIYHNIPLATIPEIKVAIFDFDGTISTLRCNWERIMEPLMLEYLSPCQKPSTQIVKMVEDYIDESTGIQTIFQMEWLSDMVSKLNHTQPLDAWIYKDEYNTRLLEMISNRMDKLSTGEFTADDYLVNGSKIFLNMLCEKHIDIYIASGTDDVDLQKEVALLGIDKFIKSSKGAPHRQKNCSKEAIIKDFLDNQKLSGEQILVVGDGKVEIMLGNDVNAVTIGVACNEASQDGQFNIKKFNKLEAANANYIVADFNALLYEESI